MPDPHDPDHRNDTPQPRDRLPRTVFGVFVGLCLALAGVFVVFPSTWDNLLAANGQISRSMTIMSIVCR
jgi:hypothetical protein